MGRHPTCHPSSCLLPFASVALSSRQCKATSNATLPCAVAAVAGQLQQSRSRRKRRFSADRVRYLGRLEEIVGGWCAGNLCGWTVSSGLGTRCIEAMRGLFFVDVWDDDDDAPSLRRPAGACLVLCRWHRPACVDSTGRGSSREPREGAATTVRPSSIPSRAVPSHPIEMTPMASTGGNPRKIGATSYTLPWQVVVVVTVARCQDASPALDPVRRSSQLLVWDLRQDGS